MKSLKKIIKVISILILFLFLGIVFYLYTSGPSLPEETDEIIENVLADPLPELVKGETGFVKSDETNIWYESISPVDSTKGVVLMIMGISNDALGWPPEFIHSFVSSGYQVIRYDHRGTGRSDWLENWDDKNPYTLADMGKDGILILDKLGIQKAHVIGVSMGGMIAQELAINHPQRIHSLSSIMSSGDIFDETLPPISSKVAFDLIKVALKYGIIGTERNMIKLHIASRLILKGDAKQELDIKDLSEQVLYNLRKRKGYNHKASAQHQAAVAQSTSRYEDLLRFM